MRIVVGLLVAVAIGVALVAAATRRFHHRTEDEARALVAGARDPGARTVDASELERLPAPVRRWLELSGAVGRPRAATVRLKQRGEMRVARDKPWMPVAAEQYFSIDPPGFVWGVDARMMQVLPIAGRDRYVGGHGHMLIKVASLVTVADATGPEIDQGAMLRFLSEIVWFPSAALSDQIAWQQIDERSARDDALRGRRRLRRVHVRRARPGGEPERRPLHERGRRVAARALGHPDHGLANRPRHRDARAG